MDKNVLEKLRETELEIMDTFDRVCRENSLRYSLYAGTLLGAIRHNGFIPWDDDMDVCMPREDYERFIELWPSLGLDNYYILNNDISNKFTQSFTKMYKKNTTLITTCEIVDELQTGIDIDIFPVDRIPHGRVQRLRFKIQCMFYHLFMRKYIPTEASGAIQFACRMILKLTNRKNDVTRIHRLLNNIKKSNDNKNNDIILIETMRTLKRIYPSNIFDELIEVQFEGRKYYSFKDWDIKLSIDFGDYTTLPPVEDRVPPHNPILIDFNKNYHDLCKEGLGLNDEVWNAHSEKDY